jgi:hypothetical protein
MVKGELLVSKDTPPGPPNARVAWAREMGTLVTIVDAYKTRAGFDVAYFLADNPGRVFSATDAEVLADYERPG